MGTVGLARGVEDDRGVEVKERVGRTEAERVVDVRKRPGDVARAVQRPPERVVDEDVVGPGVERAARQLDGTGGGGGVVGVIRLEDRHLEIGDLTQRLLQGADGAHEVERSGGGDPLTGLLLQIAEERDHARHGKAPGEVAEAADGVGAPAARHVDTCLTDLGEHELGFEAQRLLVRGVGGADVAAAELEVAEQRGDGRAVEGDPVGGGVGGADPRRAPTESPRSSRTYESRA